MLRIISMWTVGLFAYDCKNLDRIILSFFVLLMPRLEPLYVGRWKHLVYQLSYFLRDEPCNSTVKKGAHQMMLKYVPFFRLLLQLSLVFLRLRRVIWSTRAVPFPPVLTVSQRKGLCAQRQKCFTLKPTLVSYLKNKITTATSLVWSMLSFAVATGKTWKPNQDSLVLKSASLCRWPPLGRAERCLLMIPRWVLLVPFLTPYCSFTLFTSLWRRLIFVLELTGCLSRRMLTFGLLPLQWYFFLS